MAHSCIVVPSYSLNEQLGDGVTLEEPYWLTFGISIVSSAAVFCNLLQVKEMHVIYSVPNHEIFCFSRCGKENTLLTDGREMDVFCVFFHLLWA